MLSEEQHRKQLQALIQSALDLIESCASISGDSRDPNSLAKVNAASNKLNEAAKFAYDPYHTVVDGVRSLQVPEYVRKVQDYLRACTGFQNRYGVRLTDVIESLKRAIDSLNIE